MSRKQSREVAENKIKQKKEKKAKKEKLKKTKKEKHYSAHNAKKLYCLETNRIYNSLTEFQNIHGVDRHKIKKLFDENNAEYIEVIDKSNSSLHIKISV